MDKESEKNSAGSGLSNSTKRSERRSVWLWTLFILMFFGLQALLWTTAIRITRQYPAEPEISAHSNTATRQTPKD